MPAVALDQSRTCSTPPSWQVAFPLDSQVHFFPSSMVFSALTIMPYPNVSGYRFSLPPGSCITKRYRLPCPLHSTSHFNTHASPFAATPKTGKLYKHIGPRLVAFLSCIIRPMSPTKSPIGLDKSSRRISAQGIALRGPASNPCKPLRATRSLKEAEAACDRRRPSLAQQWGLRLF